MIFNNNRLRELEQENQQWQQWYQAQLPPQMPQYPQPYQQLPPPPKVKKKAKKGRNKVNPNPLSKRMWIFIGIMSFFAIIILKNWLTDATTPTPERVEKRKK